MGYIYTNPHEQSHRSANLEKESLQQELRSLEQREAWIKQRLVALEAYIQAIQPLLEESPGGTRAKEGLTKMCREVLGKNPRWMGAGEIRAILYQMGIDLKSYSNPMATLHSVLGRVGQKFRVNGIIYYSAQGVAPLTQADIIILGRLGNLPRVE